MPNQKIDSHEISGKIRSILADLLEVDPAEIRDDAKLEDDLGADSLLYLELFEELRDEFDLDFDLHDIERYATRHPVSTVGELIGMVTQYLEKGDEFLAELAKEAPPPSE